MKTQALSKVQHSVYTKRVYKMPILRYNVLIVSSVSIYLTASKGMWELSDAVFVLGTSVAQ